MQLFCYLPSPVCLTEERRAPPQFLFPPPSLTSSLLPSMPPSLSCCPSRFSLEDVKNLDNKSMMERETCAVVCMCVCVCLCAQLPKGDSVNHTQSPRRRKQFITVFFTLMFQYCSNSLSLALALSLSRARSRSLSLSHSLAHTFLLHLLIGEPKQCAGRYVRRKRMNM